MRVMTGLERLVAMLLVLVVLLGVMFAPTGCNQHPPKEVKSEGPVKEGPAETWRGRVR